MRKQPCVYIMASRRNGTLYIGVTARIARRTWQHRTGAVEGFTRKYRVTRLVWYEFHADMLDAIKREKQLKCWSRREKLKLIESENPDWRDLFALVAG